MRAIIVTIVIFGTIPFILMRPYIGLLVYSWISFMSPHRLAFGFAQDFPFAMMIGVIFIIRWLASRESKAVPMTPVLFLTVLFGIWVSITTIYALKGVYGQHAHMVWWDHFTKTLVITVIAMIMLNSRDRIDGFIWCMVLSIGYYGLRGGIFTILHGGVYRVYGPPGSMIDENNALAVAIIMTVPMVRYLHLRATNKHIRRGLLAAIPLLILSAIGSQSRGALLAISAMGAFMVLKSRHKMAVGVITVLLAVMALSFAPEKWYKRMETIANYEQDQSAMTRINAWMTAINLALDRPILGGGFRVLFYLRPVWLKYAPDPNKQAVAHSIYFQTLAEHGFPGLTIFVTILFLSFRTGRWMVKKTRDRPDLRWAADMGAMFQVSLVGYAVGGAFLELAYYELYWGIVATLVGARCVVAKQLAQPAKQDGDAAESAPAAAPALPRKSFLRRPGDPVDQGSFLRG